MSVVFLIIKPVGFLFILLALSACGNSSNNSSPTPVNKPRFAFAVNTDDDTLSGYIVKASSGQLLHNGYAVTGSEPVAVAVTQSGLFAYVANRGSNDISAYMVDEISGQLSQIDCGGGVGCSNSINFAAGTGPVDIILDRQGELAFAINGTSNDISAYQIDTVTGVLTQVDCGDVAGCSMMVNFATGAGPGAVAMDRNRNYLFITHFDSDDISVYDINSATGYLTRVDCSLIPAAVCNGMNFAAGDGPVAITLDASSNFAYVVNQLGGDISVFDIDASTGALTSAGPNVVPTAGTSPKDFAIHPSGNFAYSANAGSGNVSTFSVNMNTGELSPSGLAILAGSTPSSIVVEPGGEFVYTTNASANTVSAYNVDKNTGMLLALDHAPTIGTRNNPAAIAITRGDQAVTISPGFAYVVDEIANTITAYDINIANGALSQIETPLATGSTPTGVTTDPLGRYAYVANSFDGMTGNSISSFEIDAATGALTYITEVAAGSGPAGIAFDPSSRFLYVANSVDAMGGNTVQGYNFEPADGTLTSNGTTATGTAPLAVATDPTGRFIYAANSGTDNISGYAIDPATGVLTSMGAAFSTGMNTAPAAVAVDPTGRFVVVANQDSNDISAFTVNLTSGILTQINCAAGCNGSNFNALTSPVAVAIDPTGRYAYVANFVSAAVTAYAINTMTGILTNLGNFDTGMNPTSVTVDPSGQFLFVTNRNSGTVSRYRIDSDTGLLTELTAKPTPGDNPVDIHISTIIN